MLLVMMDKDYQAIRILIFIKTKKRLRTGLKTHGILKDALNFASLDTEIFILVKKNFIDFMIRIISDSKCKTNVDFLLYNKTYFFMHDVKTTETEQFSDLKMFYINNF